MSTKLNIITIPNPILRQKATKIKDPADPEIQAIIKGMEKIMSQLNGLGLAGPQVGIGKRIILIQTQNGALPLINPVIQKKSKQTSIDTEGCLSIPKTFGTVKRADIIEVWAISIKGTKIKFKAEGLFARAIQHEIDHLDGILFTDKVIKYTQKPKR